MHMLWCSPMEPVKAFIIKGKLVRIGLKTKPFRATKVEKSSTNLSYSWKNGVKIQIMFSYCQAAQMGSSSSSWTDKSESSCGKYPCWTPILCHLHLRHLRGWVELQVVDASLRHLVISATTCPWTGQSQTWQRIAVTLREKSGKCCLTLRKMGENQPESKSKSMTEKSKDLVKSKSK